MVTHFRSLRDLDRAVIKALPTLPRDLAMVVGVPRSGLLAANLLSLYLNVPLTDLEGFVEGRLIKSGQRPVKGAAGAGKPKVLVVEDSVALGRQMNACKKRLEDAGMYERYDIHLAAVFVNPNRVGDVDMAFEVVPLPRVFQWNAMHSERLNRYCLDIDGVLCEDPTEEENDDGPRYLEFLENSRPLFLPTVEVGWLVTSRLEKYRKQTEAWMARHGVRYGELVMRDLPSKAARQQAEPHGVFKGRVYKRLKAELFIESNPQQAPMIAQVSRRPVLCVETMELIEPSGLAALTNRLAEARWKLRRRTEKAVKRVVGWNNMKV